MEKIDILYNPYLNSTRLNIDGKEHKPSGKRIDEFIVGQNLESWLSPYIDSYKKWNGLLVELMDELNDDELKITIHTLPEFYNKIKEELEDQVPLVEESGYEMCNLSLEIKNYSDKERLVSTIQAFIQKERHFIGQFGLHIFGYIESNLQRTSDLTIVELKHIYEDIEKAIMNEKNRKPDSGHWEKSLRELSCIFWR